MMKISKWIEGTLWFFLLFFLFACNPPAAPPTQVSEPAIESTITSQPSMAATPTIISSLTTPIIIAPLVTEAPQILQVTPTARIAPGGPLCADKSIHLDIPDRDEDENAPEEGWCGETSIQMALEYYGKKVSQQAINLAGKPQHPDLWEDDINVALDALSVKYEGWDEHRWDVDGFLHWIAGQLQAGYPVLLGVKIYPDEHPNWEVDHFVLVVGCDEEGIIINTNNAGEGQVHVTYDELTTNFEDSYSLINRQKYLFGRAIKGIIPTDN